eukprot:TRINITY_DN6898_c0_g1_i2.p1 TRINITY_DN6898_c0_g1~~TRINITY_DN6898_c0_g1_i2.p1  ORF type:complete len:485 (-),score=22.68 TRINITY_DN6898_c0_g1_i2:84-1538(-)
MVQVVYVYLALLFWFVLVSVLCVLFFFFFSSRRRHTRCREVSWARRCVQETGTWVREGSITKLRLQISIKHNTGGIANKINYRLVRNRTFKDNQIIDCFPLEALLLSLFQNMQKQITQKKESQTNTPRTKHEKVAVSRINISRTSADCCASLVKVKTFKTPTQQSAPEGFFLSKLNCSDSKRRPLIRIEDPIDQESIDSTQNHIKSYPTEKVNDISSNLEGEENKFSHKLLHVEMQSSSGFKKRRYSSLDTPELNFAFSNYKKRFQRFKRYNRYRQYCKCQRKITNLSSGEIAQVQKFYQKFPQRQVQKKCCIIKVNFSVLVFLHKTTSNQTITSFIKTQSNSHSKNVVYLEPLFQKYETSQSESLEQNKECLCFETQTKLQYVIETQQFLQNKDIQDQIFLPVGNPPQLVATTAGKDEKKCCEYSFKKAQFDCKIKGANISSFCRVNKKQVGTTETTQCRSFSKMWSLLYSNNPSADYHAEMV